MAAQAEPAEQGAATAELAMLLPAVLFLLGLLVFSGHAVIIQVRLEDAAWAVARQAARGADSESITAIVRRLGGAEASAVVNVQGELTSVEVSAPMAGPFGDLLGGRLSARATAQTETSVGAEATP